MHQTTSTIQKSKQKLLTVIDLVDIQKPNKLIHELIKKRIETGSLFFGIEVSAYTKSNGSDLNFNEFFNRSGLPLFTSITWMAPDNINKAPIEEAPSIKLSQTILSVPVMMHITCADLTHDLLRQILSSDVANVMALRGGECTTCLY